MLAAGLVGAAFGALHGFLCSRPRVNDIAVGIALMLLGTGLAFFLGKPLIKPIAPRLPSLPLGGFSDVPQVRSALDVNPLWLLGVALAAALVVFLTRTRWGLILRTVGESADAARASLGINGGCVFATLRALLPAAPVTEADVERGAVLLEQLCERLWQLYGEEPPAGEGGTKGGSSADGGERRQRQKQLRSHQKQRRPRQNRTQRQRRSQRLLRFVSSRPTSPKSMGCRKSKPMKFWPTQSQ